MVDGKVDIQVDGKVDSQVDSKVDGQVDVQVDGMVDGKVEEVTLAGPRADLWSWSRCSWPGRWPGWSEWR